MKTIVITGGIATGKSTVVKYLMTLGGDSLVLFDCDAEVSKLLDSGVLARSLTEQFGAECVLENGAANRRFLRELVFHQPGMRKRLEDIIHPILHQECLAKQEKARQNSCVRGFVVDVPLFFETSASYEQDAVCVVALSRDTQKVRLAHRNGFQDDMIEAILAAQLPILEKVARADFVIWNEGNLSLLHQQTERFYHHLFHD